MFDVWVFVSVDTGRGIDRYVGDVKRCQNFRKLLFLTQQRSEFLYDNVHNLDVIVVLLASKLYGIRACRFLGILGVRTDVFVSRHAQ